jgi:hypothetical protein
MLFRAMTSTLLQQGAVGGFFVAVWHRGAMTFVIVKICRWGLWAQMILAYSVERN